MKKLPIGLLCAFVAAPLLQQCASQDELNQIHYQLRMLNKKVTDLESRTIDDIQKRQASTVNQIDRLQQDLLELKGGLDETGHLNRRLNEQSKELESAFRTYTQQEEEKRLAEVKRLELELANKDQQLEAISQQVKSQQENLQAIQQARVEEAKRKAEAAAQAAAEARRKADAANRSVGSTSVASIKADKQKKLISGETSSPSPAPQTENQPAPAPSQPAAPQPAQPAATAGKAKSLYDQGKYREAYQAFEAVAKSGSGGESIEARYMMGECLFALKEYDQAILDYQNIITNNPSSAKAPTAMLRQAMAFENLNDKETAKILYKKLVASYKDAPEAAQAQQKLSGM